MRGRVLPQWRPRPPPGRCSGGRPCWRPGASLEAPPLPGDFPLAAAAPPHVAVPEEYGPSPLLLQEGRKASASGRMLGIFASPVGGTPPNRKLTRAPRLSEATTAAPDSTSPSLSSPKNEDELCENFLK